MNNYNNLTGWEQIDPTKNPSNLFAGMSVPKSVSPTGALGILVNNPVIPARYTPPTTGNTSSGSNSGVSDASVSKAISNLKNVPATPATSDTFTNEYGTFRKETRTDGNGNSYTVNIKIAEPAKATPTTSTTTQTNPSDTRVDYYTQAMNDFSKNLETEKSKLETEKEAMRAARIDSITKLYQSKEQGINKLGEDTLARQRTLNLRSGTMDSPIGDTKIGETKTNIQAAIDANNAAKFDAINAAIAEIDNTYYKRKQDTTENAINNLNLTVGMREKAQKELADQRTKVTNSLTNIAKAGGTYEQFKLDPSYENVKQDLSEDEIKAIFTLNRPQQDVLEKKLIGNQYVQVVKNPLTGAITTESIKLPFNMDNYKHISTANNTMLFAPENWDGDMSKLKSYTVTSTKPTATDKRFTFTNADTGKLTAAGLTVEDVKNIENDLKTATLDEVLAAPELNDTQRKIIKDLINPPKKSTTGSRIGAESI